MKVEIDLCSKCNKPKPIVNKKYRVCEECNYFRLHGKSYQEVVYERERKKISIKRKKRVNVYKRVSKIQQIHERDRETYFQVFQFKKHKCEECGVELPNQFEEDGRIVMIEQYSHILSKGAYPEFRNNLINFNRLCGRDHTRWESGDRENMLIYEKNKIVIQSLLDQRNEERNKK